MTSPRWPGGPCAKASPSLGRATSPTRRGRRNCARHSFPPNQGCCGSGPTWRRGCGAPRPPVAGSRCASCCRPRSPPFTGVASGPGRFTICSTHQPSRPRTGLPPRWRRSGTSPQMAARSSGSTRVICWRSRLTRVRVVTWCPHTSGHPGSRCSAPSPGLTPSRTATRISRSTCSPSRPGCPPIRR